MSRSGYSDDCDNIGLWRANVRRAINGKKGQAFFRELAAAMDAMPVKELIDQELVRDDGGVCAIGAVCVARGIDATKVASYCPDAVGKAVGISHVLAAEIEFMNDEWERHETPAARWIRMREWVEENINKDAVASA